MIKGKDFLLTHKEKMAKYKLTTVLYHEDNCEAESAFMQDMYIKDIVNSSLQDWERVETELVVSSGNKVKTFKKDGEKPTDEIVDIRNHPWQKMTDRKPPVFKKLLFYDKRFDDLFFGIYDADYNDVHEEFYHASFDEEDFDRLSWRTIEKPDYED